MKRMLSVLLSIAFFCVLLTSCASGGGDAAQAGKLPTGTGAHTENRQTDTEQTAEEALIKTLLSDLFSYLYYSESVYGDMLWALSYVESFTDHPTWEALLTARAAVEAAAEDIAAREAPTETITSADYAALLQQGMDVSYVSMLMAQWDEERDMALSVCDMFRKDLALDVFWRRSLQTMSKDVELYRETYEIKLESAAVNTDGVLMDLGENRQEEAFRNFLKEHCPRIAAYRNDSYENENALFARANAISDSLETLATRTSEQIGEKQADIDVLLSADWNVLVPEAVPIGGLSAVLPMETLGDGESSLYRWRKADGTPSALAAGESIDRAPDVCVITWNGATKETILRYCETIADLGWENSGAAEDGGQYILSYELGDSVLYFMWEADTLKIYMQENPICFAPLWYIYASGLLPQ